MMKKKRKIRKAEGCKDGSLVKSTYLLSSRIEPRKCLGMQKQGKLGNKMRWSASFACD